MPQIEWDSSFSSAPDGHFSHMFIESIQECGLVQHVTKATRYREGVTPSTLDVILSNEEGLVQNLVYLPPIGNCDHVVLQFDLTCYAQIVEYNGVRLNFNKGNYQLLNELIRQCIWDVTITSDIDRRYEAFINSLSQLVARSIPKACPKGKRKNIYINREAMRTKKKKRQLWLAYTRNRDSVNYARYVRCKNDLRRLTRNLRKEFERELVANIKDNPKGFWRYASSRMKSRSGVENLRTEEGGLTINDSEKADVLNSFFSSVCTIEDLSHIPVPAVVYVGPAMNDVSISEGLAKKKMSALRPSAAAGPDGVHPRVLHETAATLSPQLASIFRESVDTGVVPQAWKVADVVPIYKKGGKEDPGNYRPVSLTSVPCKILESIIRDQLMTHLQTEGLLADAQHGFRPGRSCTTQLLLAVEEWSRIIERGEPVDVLYLDLAKAFNTVPRRRFLRKPEGGSSRYWWESTEVA